MFEYKTQIDKTMQYDVVVIGSGPAGLTAAIAAARKNARVIIIESQGMLGGMGTSGLVSHWLGGRSDDCCEWVVGGIFRELSERAAESGIAVLPQRPENNRLSPHGWGRDQLNAGVPFDPFRMSVMLDEVVEENGITVLLQTVFIDAVVENGHIEHIIVHNKSGLQLVSGQIFIDASGDADLAARSGCLVIKGRSEDNLMTPATVEMHIDGVDTETMSNYIHKNNAPRFLEEIVEWQETGEWPFIYNRFISVMLNEPDTFLINTSRLCDIDGTDGTSISEGLRLGRKENIQLLNFLRRNIPGMSNARLKAMGSTLGIRESRRIQAEYMLSVDDLCNGTDFDDIIGFSAYGWDLPDPKKPSLQPMENKQVAIAANRTPLPFRIMLPQPIKNLICPGRAVSVERDVLGPVRVMAPCMAMGQAAGTAAAMNLTSRDFSQTDIPVLRKTLKQDNAIVDWVV